MKKLLCLLLTLVPMMAFAYGGFHPSFHPSFRPYVRPYVNPYRAPSVRPTYRPYSPGYYKPIPRPQARPYDTYKAHPPVKNWSPSVRSYSTPSYTYHTSYPWWMWWVIFSGNRRDGEPCSPDPKAKNYSKYCEKQWSR